MPKEIKTTMMIEPDGLHIERTIHIDEEMLRLLTQDDGFADYLRKIIQEEFDRRMEKALRALATGEKENAEID